MHVPNQLSSAYSSSKTEWRLLLKHYDHQMKRHTSTHTQTDRRDRKLNHAAFADGNYYRLLRRSSSTVHTIKYTIITGYYYSCTTESATGFSLRRSKLYMTVIADVRERDNDDVIVCAGFVCNELRDHRQFVRNHQITDSLLLLRCTACLTAQHRTSLPSSASCRLQIERPFLYEAVRFITNRTRCLTMEQ